MTPAALALLRQLADGYHIVTGMTRGGYFEPGGYLVKEERFGEDRVAPAKELAAAGLLDYAANGSGRAWINDKGLAKLRDA